MIINTSMQLLGKRVETKIQIGNLAWHANTNSGRALERAINDSHATAGIHSPKEVIEVRDNIQGSRTTYPIIKDKFLALLAGHGVREEISTLFI